MVVDELGPALGGVFLSSVSCQISIVTAATCCRDTIQCFLFQVPDNKMYLGLYYQKRKRNRWRFSNPAHSAHKAREASFLRSTIRVQTPHISQRVSPLMWSMMSRMPITTTWYMISLWRQCGQSWGKWQRRCVTRNWTQKWCRWKR